MALQQERGSTFPILIDDGTVFDRFDPERVTPHAVWVRPGAIVHDIGTVWNTDVIEEFVGAQ